MRYNITSRVEFIIILYEWRNAAFAGLVTVHGGAVMGCRKKFLCINIDVNNYSILPYHK
jgi:hypothetical protein